MKKVILGLVAVGALIALRPLVKRRMVQKMRAHCQQMAAHCKEMMGAQGEGRRDDPLAAEQEHPREPVATA